LGRKRDFGKVGGNKFQTIFLTALKIRQPRLNRAKSIFTAPRSFPVSLTIRERAAGFLPDRVFFPLYNYLGEKRDFGKVAVKKFENIFYWTKKSPERLNLTGQTAY
jgi:hypothetical protein